jgi:hypothetical protein
MKKISFILFIFTSFFVLLFSSCREGIVEPTRLLELLVVDSLGVPVPNAKVDFYFTETALQTKGSQIIETLYTNQEGMVKVALDVEIFDYYVNVEKNELNNWYTNTVVSLPNLREKNTVTIVINNPFEAKLTGRYKKRWQQTDDIINGNPSFPNCSNQLYHDFIRRIETDKNRRDGELEKYQTSICPFPGTSEGINQWSYNQIKHTITFGIDNFAEIYKVVEFTGDKLSLVYSTPDGTFTVERRYKLVD